MTGRRRPDEPWARPGRRVLFCRAGQQDDERLQTFVRPARVSRFRCSLCVMVTSCVSAWGKNLATTTWMIQFWKKMNKNNQNRPLVLSLAYFTFGSRLAMVSPPRRARWTKASTAALMGSHVRVNRREEGCSSNSRYNNSHRRVVVAEHGTKRAN